MIEYGLSVSVNGSPRTPDCPRSSSFTPTTTNCAAPRKIMKFADICHDDGGGGGGGSLSPRILFPVPLTENNVRRRLDISFSRLMDEGGELSPVSFTVSASASASASGTFSGGSVGGCCVCYANLPLRANHVFTMCGHLYCVRCLLKWWDTSSTCPVCRAELYEPDAVDADAVDAVDADEADAVDAVDGDADVSI